MRLFGDGEVGEDGVVVARVEACLLVGVAWDLVSHHPEAPGGVPQQDPVDAPERFVRVARLEAGAFEGVEGVGVPVVGVAGGEEGIGKAVLPEDLVRGGAGLAVKVAGDDGGRVAVVL